MQELLDLLAGRKSKTTLDVVAFQLAGIEYPGVVMEPYGELLDSHAAELAERLDENTSGERFVEMLTAYLAEESGFTANREDYYAPANSCLNEVLTQRVGIPITLSLVYMEVARRLHRPVVGIGLPGHFVIQYRGSDYSTYIDPFNDGALLTRRDCVDLVSEVTRTEVAYNSPLLEPVPKRQIAIRMLNNLRSIYFNEQEPNKAIQVLNLLIEANSTSADEFRQRGICFAKIQRYRNARADFETYLRLAPGAGDRQEVENEIGRLKRRSSQPN